MNNIIMDLRNMRRSRGLSQHDLSDLTGLRQPTIVELERGARVPHNRTRQTIEGVIGPVDWQATFAGSERKHLFYSLRGFLNPEGTEGSSPQERIRIARQSLKVIENDLNN